MTLMAFVRYGLHLIHVMEAHWLRDKLAAVKFSVTQNFGALLITLLMLLIFVYMASLIAFAAFRDSYDQQDGMFCDTLLQCFLTTTSFGLRMGGGIGDALLVETSSSIRPVEIHVLGNRLNVLDLDYLSAAPAGFILTFTPR